MSGFTGIGTKVDLDKFDEVLPKVIHCFHCTKPSLQIIRLPPTTLNLSYQLMCTDEACVLRAHLMRVSITIAEAYSAQKHDLYELVSRRYRETSAKAMGVTPFAEGDDMLRSERQPPLTTRVDGALTKPEASALKKKRREESEW